jgi:predicted RNA binding protein YcfA (HicA-like mRNA interferase family)
VKHIAAFKRAGWRLDHVEGSHYILVKKDARLHLSVPMHKGQDLPVGLLKGLIRDAGLTNEEYMALFHRRKRER